MLAASCAQPGAPGGGDVDETPPRVVATRPPDMAVDVPRDTEVALHFSEQMRRESVEQSLFITPYPDPYPLIRWSTQDRVARVAFDDDLNADRTYVLTVGTDASDAHGNRLAVAHTFAFASGASFDSGVVSGGVWRFPTLEPAVGATIGLYPVVDAPDPGSDYAAYQTQAGDDGSFAFHYLAADTYRVFAWDDRDGDSLLDPGEALGVPSRDVAVTTTAAQDTLPGLMLDRHDPLAPELLFGRARDSRHIELRFNESVLVREISVTAPDSEPLEAVAVAQPDPTREVTIATGEMRANETYGIRAVVLDQAGNVSGFAADTTLVDASASPDTARPHAVVVVAPEPIIGDSVGSVTLWFDDEIGDVALDSLRALRDSTAIVGSWSLERPNRIVFAPVSRMSATSETWIVPLAPVSDATGNHSRDSVRINLNATPTDSLGEAEGVVKVADYPSGARIVVRAMPLRAGWWRDVARNGPGPWRIERLPAGQYRVFAWLDSDGDGEWSPGSATPFVPAERWARGDTLRVRARWAVPGGTLTVK